MLEQKLTVKQQFIDSMEKNIVVQKDIINRLEQKLRSHMTISLNNSDLDPIIEVDASKTASSGFPVDGASTGLEAEETPIVTANQSLLLDQKNSEIATLNGVITLLQVEK